MDKAWVGCTVWDESRVQERGVESVNFRYVNSAGAIQVRMSTRARKYDVDALGSALCCGSGSLKR